MRVVVAIDSLKGSLSSLEAGDAIREGVQKVYPEADVKVLPLADGGEGTVEALTAGMGGRLESISVTGPLGDPVACTYGLIESEKKAIIEMSGAAGITLIPDEKRNPLYTTTYGVGEVIRDALNKGCRKFMIGIGGSATNDGGIGMLQALGYEFLDAEGRQVPFGAIGLKNLHSISEANALPELQECEFRVACDVSNMLCGPEGCSNVFGPQKGATPEMIRDMDQWLMNYASLTAEIRPLSDAKKSGTGAAGGLGFAFLSFLNAVLEPGIDIVLKEIDLESYMPEADVVITGEGRLDSQTVMGKAPIGVAGVAAKYQKPVIAFAGMVTEDAGICNEHGINAFFPILRRVVTLQEAMDTTISRKNMVDTVEQAFRLIKTFAN